MLTKNKKLICRRKKLNFRSFNQLASTAPKPDNKTLASYNTYDREMQLLEMVERVKFTIIPTDLDGTLTPGNKEDDQVKEQKIRIEVAQDRHTRFGGKGNLTPVGSTKIIEFSFIPQVPVQRLPF
ncbi:hypothetical protein ACFL35_11585 [Candidatus Riflebacteria bacterium]